MRHRATLIIFLRAPQSGAIKRRLARGIGDGLAQRFYIATSRALIRHLGANHRWRTVLAVTPDAFAGRARFWPRGIARLKQGQGDLGTRMGRLFEQLPPGPVVLIGSDIPSIRAHHVAAAFEALSRHEAVFGPAADGGYWLVGLARRRYGARALTRRLFSDVRWSGPHALADTRAGLPAGAEAPPLDVLEDIDDTAAYDRFRQS